MIRSVQTSRPVVVQRLKLHYPNKPLVINVLAVQYVTWYVTEWQLLRGPVGRRDVARGTWTMWTRHALNFSVSWWHEDRQNADRQNLDGQNLDSERRPSHKSRAITQTFRLSSSLPLTFFTAPPLPLSLSFRPSYPLLFSSLHWDPGSKPEEVFSVINAHSWISLFRQQTWRCGTIPKFCSVRIELHGDRMCFPTVPAFDSLSIDRISFY